MKRINKGQSLLEFSLVAPILIMVLVVISELGYAFVVRHTIIDSIKQSIQSTNFMVGKYATQAELIAAMKKDLQDYIAVHNIPPPVDLKFGIGTTNQYGTSVTVSYTYKPSFRLIGITPEQVTLKSCQVVPPGLVKINNPTVPQVPDL